MKKTWKIVWLPSVLSAAIVTWICLLITGGTLMQLIICFAGFMAMFWMLFTIISWIKKPQKQSYPKPETWNKELE